MYSRFYLSVLLMSGLVLVTYLVLTAYDGVMPEWKHYQIEYKELLIKNAKDDATRTRAQSMQSGLRQTYLAGLKREDRCVNCHLGVDNPMMADAKLPFKKHSGNYLANHPVDKFGCTVCHDGQGSATTLESAHGKGHGAHWDRPVLPLEYVQSSCAQCHDFDMLSKNGGAKVAGGETLFNEKGCRGCHKVNGRGGSLGKTLDKVGSEPIAYFSMKHVIGDHTVYNWLKRHFEDPQNIMRNSEMKVSLKGSDSALLTMFAMTLRSDEMPKQYRDMKYTPEVKLNGESLYKRYCIACHEDGTRSLYNEIFNRTIPAIRNPAFLKAADDKTLETIIKEGRKSTQMTSWKTVASGVSDEDVKNIIGYLSEKRPAEKYEPFPIPMSQGEPNNGKNIFETHCSVCHGKDGRGGEDRLGVSLRSPVVQKMVNPEFLAATIRDGRSGTPMPPFGKDAIGLGDKDIADVVAYVRAFPK
ncbi:MAG: c-type cytochrome [Nitrospirae bacterium]|nr:c-type cytochrome [Nitrospirota bacterium]